MISSMGCISLTDEEKYVITLILFKNPHQKVFTKDLIIATKEAFLLDTPIFDNAVQIYIAAITKHFCFQGLLHKGIGYAWASILTY